MYGELNACLLTFSQMNKQVLDKLIQEGRARHAGLTKPWKPYQKILWFISVALTAYRYRRDAGVVLPAKTGHLI